MRASKCAFSTAAALRRVFIVPHEHQSRILSLRPSSFTPHPIQASRATVFQQSRSLVNTTKAAKSRLPRDDEIQSDYISLVDEDGKLGEPINTYYILSGIDRKTYSLVTVVENEPGVPPICKIMNKQKMRESERAAAKAARKGALGTQTKTIELNWAVWENDLKHRLVQLRKFLAKGFKVEVLCSPKRKGKKAEEDQAKALIKAIKDEVMKSNGRETKVMEGGFPAEARLFFQGPRQRGNDKDDLPSEEDIEKREASMEHAEKAERLEEDTAH